MKDKSFKFMKGMVIIMIRLQKYLSDCGVASRRKAEELILSGHVQVNGKTVTEMGVKVDASRDKVLLDGNNVAAVDEKIYLALNKPRGVISAVSDQFGRKCVTDLIGSEYRIFPVGRLDYNTSGLILLTNDGEFANRVMHPRNNIEKIYIVKISGGIKPESLDKLRRGVKIDGVKTSPASVEIMEEREKSTLIAITIFEGRNRQVRKMFEAVGARTLRLERISIGSVTLGNLKPGEFRLLTKEERAYFK